MSNKRSLNDTTLKWLYRQYKQEQARLPEEERVGFRVWCRRAGILTPERQDQIAHIEVPFRENGYEDDSE